MNSAMVNDVVDAVLYEGYILYPYRASSKKNQHQRFTFGRVYPQAYSEAQNGVEPCAAQTECLLTARPETLLTISVRFLHPLWREIGALPEPLPVLPENGEPPHEIVPQLSINGKFYQTWQEAVERRVELSLTGESPQINLPFSFAATRNLEPVLNEDGNVAAVIVRSQQALAGIVEATLISLSEGRFKIRVRVVNQSAITGAELEKPDAVIMRTFASTHIVLGMENGEFVSVIDPPENFREFTDGCKNIGVWPVLVGDEARGERDTVLASPIILYDYPKIAPQSAGNFGDSLEMDQMLTLRVMTMTEAEKKEMQVDEFARRILERAQNTDAASFMRMHGTLQEVKSTEHFFNPPDRVKTAVVDGIELRAGDRVIIRPKRRADAMDIILAGKTAIIEAVEEDTEGQLHLALVVEDDPGRDMGMARQSGHRFFYGSDEVEPLKEGIAV
jgi:hypothetical protein